MCSDNWIDQHLESRQHQYGGICDGYAADARADVFHLIAMRQNL
jgi:hypothetical protein